MIKKTINDIRNLEHELNNEIKMNGEFSKRAVFLKATINRYLHFNGKESWYEI